MSNNTTPKISEKNPLMRLFEENKPTIKSPGNNLNYLKIYLYKNGALLKEFEPSMINPKYNKTIIFPSDFILDSKEINKILFNKNVFKEGDDEQDYDILYGNLDANKINKLRISANNPTKETIDKNITKNINLIYKAFIEDKIINLEGTDYQMTRESKITSKYNKILYQKLKNDKEMNSSKYMYNYSRSNFNNMNYFFDNSNGKGNEFTFHFNGKTPMESEQLKGNNDEIITALLQSGGLIFHLAVDVELTNKIKRKSDLRRVISPFDSCKTKRRAILELLDYKLNIFETDVLRLNKISQDKIKKKEQPLNLFSKALSGNKSSAKSSAKSNAKPDAKPNAKPNVKPNVKSNVKPNVKPIGGKKKRTKGKRRRTTKGKRRRTTKSKRRRTRGLKSKPRKYIKTKKIKRRYI